MHDPSSEGPIDILADAPAEDPVELSGQMQDEDLQAEVAPEKVESGELQEATTKKYTNEDVYKMLSLVVRYPSGGHGGETFWTRMVKIYGNSLLEGRNGNGLRNRWRKILKEHPDFQEYKKQLGESLPVDFVAEVDKKIAEPLADVAKLGLNNKACASLFPEIAKPAEAKETGTRKRKLEDGKAEIVGEEKKKTKKAGKALVDLNLLVPKRASELSKLTDVALLGLNSKIELDKNLVISRDTKEDRLVGKELGASGEIQTCTKIDLERENVLKGASKGLKEIKQWTLLEDLVLKYPENAEIYNCLVKLKGIDEVNKRKSQLGLS